MANGGSAAAKAGQLDAARPWSSSTAWAGLILAIVHLLSFLPLLLIVALQDVHSKLVVVLNTALCTCLAVANFCFHRMGIVQVYPKMLDTFLLLVYGSMIPVAYTQGAWLVRWLTVYHHSAVAAFMWLSLLLPFCDSFVLEALKDCLADHLCALPSSQAAATRTAQAWAAALTIMAAAALVPPVTGRTSVADPVHIVCDYVLGVLPLLLAWACHNWLLARSISAAQAWQQARDEEAPSSTTAPSGALACRSGSSISPLLRLLEPPAHAAALALGSTSRLGAPRHP